MWSYGCCVLEMLALVSPLGTRPDAQLDIADVFRLSQARGGGARRAAAGCRRDCSPFPSNYWPPPPCTHSFPPCGRVRPLA